jgi:hypothetical protein
MNHPEHYDPERSYAVVVEENGQFTGHRADCPLPRILADSGRPVVWMYECEKELGDGMGQVKIRRHECLNEQSVESEN